MWCNRLRCGVWGNCYINPSYSSLPTVARRDMSRTVTTRTTNPAELHRQNVRRTDRLIRPILELHNHRPALQRLQPMPLALLHLHPRHRILRQSQQRSHIGISSTGRQQHLPRLIPGIVIQMLDAPASQHHDSFGCLHMPIRSNLKTEPSVVSETTEGSLALSP